MRFCLVGAGLRWEWVLWPIDVFGVVAVGGAFLNFSCGSGCVVFLGVYCIVFEVHGSCGACHFKCFVFCSVSICEQFLDQL